ncbi:hypothetical protein [Prevotella sp. E13-27]|uniref:hypothetical protein n=1 Tax=Prevotella sp. E13-27 TaxID=2938122 RepID=UPI00200A6B99|nr:hypothetical protein [Prevotella sp. E13-27]MCK8623354.1 hypothetical protein [Prevotella sp. E13-27]
MKRRLLSVLALLLITAGSAWAESSVINGRFTINAEGSQVLFAHGNLQAECSSADGDSSTPETFTWRFAANQLDCIGGYYDGGSASMTGNNYINGNGSLSAAGTVDLFNWVGASSSLTGDAAYGINKGDDNAGEGLKTDWGNMFGAGWRTLSKDEWDYVFNTRSTTSDVRYAKATVNGVAGVILLPDDWSTSYYTLASTNIAAVNFSANTINSSDWTSSLEAHGAVFLPAAGYRSSDKVLDKGTKGFYWSSSSVSEDNTKAYCLKFGTDNLQAQSSDNRVNGYSVRLVKDVLTYTLAESTDNSEWISEHDGQVYDITLTRTLKAGGWNTFSVPFSIATPSGWTVKELSTASYNVGTNTLSLEFSDAASIVAGHAYMVKVEANVVNPTFSNVTISSSTTATIVTDVVEFVPSINPTALTLSDKSYLFVSGGNKLTWASSGSSMKGFRAYFHILNNDIANARFFSMGFGDDGQTTDIINLTPTLSEGEGAWYDLSGRRVQNPAKGIYIQRSAEGRLQGKNGKKVVIK